MYLLNMKFMIKTVDSGMMLQYGIWVLTVCISYLHIIYYINITFPERMIVKNIIPRNVIINQGPDEVDNHISRDDIFHYHPLKGM